jgi:hypothetical protein
MVTDGDYIVAMRRFSFDAMAHTRQTASSCAGHFPEVWICRVQLSIHLQIAKEYPSCTYLFK